MSIPMRKPASYGSFGIEVEQCNGVAGHFVLRCMSIRRARRLNAAARCRRPRVALQNRRDGRHLVGGFPKLVQSGPTKRGDFGQLPDEPGNEGAGHQRGCGLRLRVNRQLPAAAMMLAA